MTILQELSNRYIKAHNVPGLKIPCSGVKFYKQGDYIPPQVLEQAPEGLTLTSCQAAKQASLGDAVCLTKANIGCVAAATSLGLVSREDPKEINESTVYTDIMKNQSGKGDQFQPPSPKDFAEGTVYACKAAERPEFALFGKEDPGRFETLEASQKAVGDMMAIQPNNIQAVFIYSPEFDELDIEPDVVILHLRPIELTRFIQGYWFKTGERVNASMGGLRMINSDLMARPYLTQEINVSPYCLGARLIAEWGPDRMGVGIPFDKFITAVEGVEASQKGYPFELFPGANPEQDATTA